MRPLLLVFFLTLAAHSASVTLSGTLLYPFGTTANQRVNCTATITLNNLGATNTSGSDFGSTPFVYRVVNGVYSFVLEANDTLVPAGTSYHVVFAKCANSGSWTEDWVVPSNPTTTTIGSVRASIVPSPLTIFGLNQISPVGACEGCCIKRIAGVTTWQSCGGGGGGLTWNQETGTWAATPGTWASQ